MSKRIRKEPLNIAPNIVGQIIEHEDQKKYLVIDRETGDSLNPSDPFDKIKIYERQVKGWFLNRATELVEGENNGFIVLMICISYFEGIQQMREGRKSERPVFWPPKRSDWITVQKL